MKSTKKIVILILSFALLLPQFTPETSAAILYETQIFKGSNESKIKKLQEVFKGLELYFEEISGDFTHIEQDFINYQISRGIISHFADEGAGYFGAKTMEALEKEFGEKYLQLKELFLKVDEPSTEERHFQITAYYSPLPNQKKYETGSYAGDVRLNGDHTTANGKKVFPGLLAAPRNYEFGTKIYIEGLGVGEVADRGGAIVNSGERGHEYDRLDLWVGYGDEGLRRALAWGRKDVKGFIVDDSYEVNIEFDESAVSKYANLKVNAENPEVESVKKLQELFTEIGIYNGEITGNFADIKNVLVNYQLENGIISNGNDSQAGYFGAKTYNSLQAKYGKSGGLFVEKYLENPNKNSSSNEVVNILTTTQTQNMNVVKAELEKILEKMYKGNAEKVAKFKEQFKIALTNIANSSKYVNRKYEFLYLVEIL